jgi:hypothetical protein
LICGQFMKFRSFARGITGDVKSVAAEELVVVQY